MSAPYLDKWISRIIYLMNEEEDDDVIEEMREELQLLEELRERRKVRHPDCIKKYLNLLEEMKNPEDVVVISAEHTILQWVLTPEKKQ